MKCRTQRTIFIISTHISCSNMIGFALWIFPNLLSRNLVIQVTVFNTRILISQRPTCISSACKWLDYLFSSKSTLNCRCILFECSTVDWRNVPNITMPLQLVSLRKAGSTGMQMNQRFGYHIWHLCRKSSDSRFTEQFIYITFGYFPHLILIRKVFVFWESKR